MGYNVEDIVEYELPLVDTPDGRKRATLEIGWRFLSGNSEEYFSVSGSIYDYRCREPYSCGQCVEEIAEMYPEDELVQEAYRLWESSHLKNRSSIPPEDEEDIEYLLDDIADLVQN